MDISDLKSRGHVILREIIQAYAESATPVGSEFLTHRARFGVSSATIRNVMAQLESLGLITHPHTSAGRIPTDLGYRYYADLLMEPARLSSQEEFLLDSLSQSDASDPEELLEKAAELLSELTHEAGLVLVPQLAQGSFRQLELIPIDGREVVGVLIASEGMVRHATLEFEQPMEESQLERIVRFLNQELKGVPLAQIRLYLEGAVPAATDEMSRLIQDALRLVSSAPFFEEESSVILEGTHWILDAPEFKEIERIRKLMKALHEKEPLVEILRRDLAANHVKLHIGSENRGTELTDCTIAAAPYGLRGGVMGSIGVLGPTRLNYPRVTALVGRTAQALSQALQARF